MKSKLKVIDKNNIIHDVVCVSDALTISESGDEIAITNMLSLASYVLTCGEENLFGSLEELEKYSNQFDDDERTDTRLLDLNNLQFDDSGRAYFETAY